MDVLVIDDDAAVRRFVRIALELQGYTVREAVNGIQGVRAYQAQPADLVICDVFMEGQEGLETIRILRKEYPSIRVLMISGGGELPGMFLKIAEVLGAVGSLPKPFLSGNLLKAVNQCFQATKTAHSTGVAVEHPRTNPASGDTWIPAPRDD